MGSQLEFSSSTMCIPKQQNPSLPILYQKHGPFTFIIINPSPPPFKPSTIVALSLKSHPTFVSLLTSFHPLILLLPILADRVCPYSFPFCSSSSVFFTLPLRFLFSGEFFRLLLRRTMIGEGKLRHFLVESSRSSLFNFFFLPFSFLAFESRPAT